MGQSFVFDVVLGFVFLGLGWLLPAASIAFTKRLQLGLARHVFPADAANSSKPLIHIRASFDEVVFGENPPTLRGYTHSGDVQAVVQIFRYFDDLPVELEFDYFPEIRPEMKNVVIVGLSSRSDVSRELGQMLYDLGIRVRGEKQHAYYRDRAGGEYRCEHREVDGRHITTKDAGIIVRRRTENGATILLCGGIHTFGSQAAVDVALSKPFQRLIRKRKLDEFVQFVTVDVQQGGSRAGLVAVRPSIRWKDLPLQPLA